MRERILKETLTFADTLLVEGEIVEEVRPAECPDGAVRACLDRGWSLYDHATGMKGEARIIRDGRGRYRMVAASVLG